MAVRPTRLRTIRCRRNITCDRWRLSNYPTETPGRIMSRIGPSSLCATGQLGLSGYPARKPRCKRRRLAARRCRSAKPHNPINSSNIRLFRNERLRQHTRRLLSTALSRRSAKPLLSTRLLLRAQRRLSTEPLRPRSGERSRHVKQRRSIRQLRNTSHLRRGRKRSRNLMGFEKAGRYKVVSSRLILSRANASSGTKALTCHAPVRHG